MFKELLYGATSCRPYQLGYVVKDVKKSMEYWNKILNVGPFLYIPEFHAAGDATFRGEPDTHVQAMAHAYVGPFFIEFMQTLDDKPSVFKEFEIEHGFGLQHFGCGVLPEDYDEFHQKMIDAGFEDVFCDVIPPNQRIRYMAPVDPEKKKELYDEMGVGYIELSESGPGNQEFFAAIKKAAEEWDGKSLTFEL